MLACLKDPDIKIVNPPSAEDIKSWPQDIQEAVTKAQAEAQKQKEKTSEQQDGKDIPETTEQKQTARDILKEGIEQPYSKSEEIKKFVVMPELANTETIDCVLSKNNPDKIAINGTDKDGKYTFALSYDQKTGIYSYRGGKPEKIYSNDPNLKFPPLPKEALSSLQENQRRATFKAKVQAEMRNGVEFVDGDKKISIKQAKEGKSGKSYRNSATNTRK